MKSSQSSLPAQLLWDMLECARNGKDQMDLIARPEQLYKEHVGTIKILLDKAFGQFLQSQEPSEQYRKEIARYAGELKALEENRSNHLAKIKQAYDNQADAALQMVCDKLLPIMGPIRVRKALQNIPTEDLKDYLPASAQCGDQKSIVEAPSGYTTTERDELGRKQNRPTIRDTNSVGIQNQSPTQENGRHSAGIRRRFSKSNAAETTAQSKRQRTHNDNTTQAPESCVQELEPHEGDEQSSNQVELLSTPQTPDSTGVRIQISQENKDASSISLVLAASEHCAATGDVQTPSKNTVPVNMTVVDADECVIGSLGTVEPWNDHIAAILRIPVVRTIKIRRGRHFTMDHLSKVCDRSDPRGVRILACMIQAGGKIMETRCGHCRGNRGTFEHCIVLDGPLFTRCGNCEWARQRCHGASGPSATEQGRDDNAQKGCGIGTSEGVAAEHTNPYWEIGQIKTRHFASPESVKQCLSWVEDDEYFKHWVVMGPDYGQVGVLREPVDFNIQLKDISEVKWNSCIVQVKMKQADSTTPTVERPAPGDIMIAFGEPRTVLEFVEFCRRRGLNETNEEAEEMARTWLNMKSQTLLSHEPVSLDTI
ncbi:DUF3716 domain protein [Metarhizium robertsii]|uniref:DUF3716 domain protein n=2 Tax=Metarhizium robertsii TaxID=568076 RepID=E9FE59_METRA|nr:uncharacterized protein MAA_10558 [Metarhizium robertsii ARSEF 23]EFY93981.2 hypothetical protein MAA_10558 [Metarhizium robertsii ARSEF 23]EXU94537.1 DUF3716 domain protein [Metarhizium robertsii]